MDTLRDLLELTVVVDPTYAENCYVMRRRDSDAVILIDPGLQRERVLTFLDAQSLHCERILLTHGHGDHVSGVPAVVAAHGCRVALHPADHEQLLRMRMLPGIPPDTPDVAVDEDLHDGQVITWHGIDIGVIHTPGHTRGSVCFLAGTDLLSGDTLFRRGVGRADLLGGDWPTLMTSIETRLYALPADTVVHPGHGTTTTVGEEMASNPFVVHPRYR